MKIFFFLINVTCLISCNLSERFKCTYWDESNVQTRIKQLKQRIDTIELKVYEDSTYKVKIVYPRCFYEYKTNEKRNEENIVHLKYDSYETHCQFDLYLNIWDNTERLEIKNAIELELENTKDSTTKCIEENKDYFIISGRLGEYRSFVRKRFLLNNQWIDYKLVYSNEGEEAISRVIQLVKEWDPNTALYNEAQDF